jgi:tRNA U38,U39,U40 pseudouridine synthase TruA
LRDDPACSSKFSTNNKSNGEESLRKKNSKLSLVFRVAYHCSSSDDINGGEDKHQSLFHNPKDSEARSIGLMIKRSIEQSLVDLCGDSSCVLSSTQTSVASQRHRALTQENGVSSASDVLVFNLLVPHSTVFRYENTFESKSQQEFANQLLETANQYLPNNGSLDTADEDQIKDKNVSSKLVQCTPLPPETILHAEGDCTQRIYHYLLPLSWLPDGEKLEAWWLRQCDQPSAKTGTPPSDSMRRLREALKSAESPTIPNRRVRRRMNQFSETNSNNNKAAANQNHRVGAFANKERRPFFNFADRRLRGDASPNQEPVWRVLDRARIHGFMKVPKGDSVVAILEFRGDDFVPGQIRSIVATAVAIANEWLPLNTFPIALQKDLFLETPTAPAGRLYGAGSRFHFHERKLLQNDLQGAVISPLSISHHDKTMECLRQMLLTQCSFESSRNEEERWLWELEHDVSPRIYREIEVEQNAHTFVSSQNIADQNSTTVSLIESLQNEESDIVNIYNKTLGLLREVVYSGCWPETSIARSDVIRSKSIKQYNSKMKGIGRSGGSFTVFNTKILDNHLIEKSKDLPIGNIYFPKLADAVFDLEAALSTRSDSGIDRTHTDGTLFLCNNHVKQQQRPSSLCCAINCNAQFTPHVDSGRGAGQSLSMIVGLGDYTGGELFVEGISHNIRYRPLEFDGWSSRHWTDHYSGERFSVRIIGVFFKNFFVIVSFSFCSVSFHPLLYQSSFGFHLQNRNIFENTLHPSVTLTKV